MAAALGRVRALLEGREIGVVFLHNIATTILKICKRLKGKISFIDFDSNDVPHDLSECAIFLRDTIIGLTTHGGSEVDYLIARTRLMKDERVKVLLPSFVRYSQNAASLRSSLQAIASGPGSWEARRRHVTEAFSKLLASLETGEAAGDGAIKEGLLAYDAPAVQAFWLKAIERRSTDPEGAVTAASTLLEEVCKHIIEDSGRTWEKTWNMPKLYTETASILNLAPSQHHEHLFKMILGNCQSVVQSIGALRNKGGDAHAGGRSRVSFKPRHAALTVNLAGAMALFLIETWLERGNAEQKTKAS